MTSAVFISIIRLLIQRRKNAKFTKSKGFLEIELPGNISKQFLQKRFFAEKVNVFCIKDEFGKNRSKCTTEEHKIRERFISCIDVFTDIESNLKRKCFD